METKLYVGNLNFRTTEESLGQAFAEAGFAPVSVKVITDRETGRSRGFAFVELADAQAAEAALSQMSGRMVEGRPLKVTEAKPRGAGGPGGDGGFRPRPAYDVHPRAAPAGGPEGRNQGGGGFEQRSGGGGGYEARPRFGAEAPRGGRDGGFAAGPRNFSGSFAPPQPGFGPLAEEEAGRDGRRDRSKRRDMSKQHADRQDFDDDDGWA